MSNIVEKIRQKIAVKDHNQFNLPSRHITTNDFFKIKPVFIREFAPGSHVTVDMSTFSRLAPLTKPFYGHCKFVNRAFWVPFRTVFYDWNDFITNTPVNDSSTPYSYSGITTFGIDDVVSLLADHSDLYSTTKTYATLSSDERQDPSIIWDPHGDVAYFLNAKGKRFFDILSCLHYKFDFSTTYGSRNPQEYSALPLLCYFRCWLDWYSSSQYIQTLPYKSWFNPRIYSNVGVLTGDDLYAILSAVTYLEYEKDLFTAAWTNPVGPSSNTLSVAPLVKDVTLLDRSDANKSSVRISTNGTPIVLRSDGSVPAVNNFTQYIDSALKYVTDYVKRKQLAGIRNFDRFMSQFGIALPDAKLNRSVYLGKSVVPVLIGDVMSTADVPQGGELGQYAGKGITPYDDNVGHFSFDADEFGMLVICSVIVPDVEYYQGINRQNLHISPYDFYQPEFDMLGCQAISKGEVVGDVSTADFVRTAIDRSYYTDGVFGFTSRYSEYKCSQNDSNISGDMRFMPNTYRYWHMFREFTNSDLDGNIVAGQTFNTLNQSQFDKIFADMNGDNTNGIDHFITVFSFNVQANQPMSRLFDDYEFEGGREIDMPLNGTRFD